MKGINPLYFNIIKSATILLILVPLILHSIEFKTAVIIAVVLGLILMAIIYINWKKISKIDKGKVIKSVKGKIGSWHYFLAGLLFILVGLYVIGFLNTEYTRYLMAIVLLIGFTLSNFNQSYNITFYENGIVLDGLAFYTWDEINKLNKKGKTMFKIKNIPKEIVIMENNNKSIF